MANRKVRGQGRSGGRKPSLKTQLKPEKLLERTGIDLRVLNGGGYKKAVRSIATAPVLGTLVGGVGAFFAVRYLIRYYQGHPEMLSFIEDNFETIQNRIREFRGGQSAESDSDSQEVH